MANIIRQHKWNTFILFIYRDYRAQDYVTRAATLYRFYILRIQLKQILNKIFCFEHFMQISVCIEAANLHKCFTEKGFKILQNTLFFFRIPLGYTFHHYAVSLWHFFSLQSFQQ